MGMKQTHKASISVPVALKSLLKQAAARKNLFLHEFIALLLLNELDPQHNGQVGEVAQTALGQNGPHQPEPVSARLSIPQVGQE